MPLTFEEKSQRLTQALSYFRASEIAFRKGLTQLVEIDAETREPVLLATAIEDLAKILYTIDATAVAVDLANDHLSRGQLRKGGPIAAEPVAEEPLRGCQRCGKSLREGATIQRSGEVWCKECDAKLGSPAPVQGKGA